MNSEKDNHTHTCCGGTGNNCCGGEHTHDGCCGGHNHEHSEEDTMTLILDNDEELKCSVIDLFEVSDKEYIALLPIGEDEVLIYQYIENEDESFELANIETDEEFENVEKEFFKIYNDEDFQE